MNNEIQLFLQQLNSRHVVFFGCEADILEFIFEGDYNGPRELDHGIEKMREHGIMRLTKGRSANHVIQNVHVGIQGEGSH